MPVKSTDPFYFWPIVIAVVSGVLSILASILTTSLKNRADLRKIKTQLRNSYSQALFSKRIGAYPELYQMISQYLKIILSNRNNKECLKKFKEEFDAWDSTNALLFTETTTRLAFEIRQLINSLEELQIIPQSEETILYEGLYELEMCLRYELGTFELEAVGKKARMIKILEKLQNNRQEKLGD